LRRPKNAYRGPCRFYAALAWLALKTCIAN
jgi:hypothetical protein